jgi:hypothetical protein
MSLYINHENQRILWESIQQHPSIYVIPQEQRNHWFKNIVKNVYDNIPKPWFQRKITTEELNYLNQSTVRHMLGDLKPPPIANLLPRAEISPPLYNQYQQDTYTTFSAAAPSYNEESMDVGIKSAHTPMIQQRYLEKQQELESMLRQPNPTTTVDFKMSSLDEPITNMEELLQKHAREREQDLALTPNSTHDLQPKFEGETMRYINPLPVVTSTNNVKINISDVPVAISVIDMVTDQPVIKKVSALKKRITFQEEYTNTHERSSNSVGDRVAGRVSSEEANVTGSPLPKTTYQIPPEYVILEKKVLKLEEEMEVMKKLVFEIYKNRSVSSQQTLLMN